MSSTVRSGKIQVDNIEVNGSTNTSITPLRTGDSPYSVITTDSTLVVTTTANEMIINLRPASDAGIGNKIIIVDGSENASTYNIIITPASDETIQGGTADETLIIDVNGASVVLLAISTSAWIII